jgi:arylsulfatase A-like enzyme
MKPIRFLSCLLLALAAFEFSVCAQSKRAMPLRANIILIVADGLGTGDLSCYGQTQFQTPNLDRLATNGIRFTNYDAGGTASAPAFAALMLGKNTSHLPDAGFSLTANDITIAQVLQNSGYHTGLIGKWNLGDENSPGAPWEKGFDEFAGYLNPAEAENVYADYIWRYMPRFDLQTKQSNAYKGREPVYPNTGGQKGQYIPDWLMTLATRYIRNNIPDPFNHYTPFFLVVNEAVPGNGNCAVPTDAPFSEEPWPQIEKNRIATISRIDNDVGTLLHYLDGTKQAKNTVIFFTSDTVPKKRNGIDPQLLHESASPDDLRVPMIVYWPGKIPPGQVSGLGCSAKDFLPTAASIGLTQSPGKVDGVSLSSTLFGQTPK